MKIFFDTNVLVAAFISHGTCSELFDYCLKKHLVYTSDFVLDELTEKLIHKFKFTEAKILWAQDSVRTHAVIAPEILLTRKICKDPDDDHIIAAAAHARVDCIITGDKLLQEVKTAFNIPIIAPRDFWKFEENFKAQRNP